MALNKIDSAETWQTNERTQFEPESRQTKTGEQNIEFNKWHGQYREIPELQGILDRLALWVIYGGDEDQQADIEFESKAQENRFKKFTGYGKDTPEEIFRNLFIMGKVCGTTTAEIIKTTKAGVINIKPIDPGTITVHQNKNGFLSKFEQTSTKSGSDGLQEKPKDIPLDKMFYIAWNRIADEVIGIPTGEKLQRIIDWRHQAMENLAEVYHRYINPFWVFYVDTDDETEIDEFNTKIKRIFNEKGRDHLTIPQDTVSKHERLSVPQFSTLDPLNWIKHLERYFLISEGVPELISGIGRETADAASRMIYLAWRIVVIANQKIYEKHIESQLGLKIKFPRPVNILAPELTETRTEVLPARDKNDKSSHKTENA